MCRRIKKVLKILGWVMMLGFVGFCIYDAYMYEQVYKYYSSPFYLYVVIRFISFGVPGLFCLVASHIIKSDHN